MIDFVYSFLTDLSVFPSRSPVLGFHPISQDPTGGLSLRKGPLPRGRKSARFGRIPRPKYGPRRVPILALIPGFGRGEVLIGVLHKYLYALGDLTFP